MFAIFIYLLHSLVFSIIFLIDIAFLFTTGGNKDRPIVFLPTLSIFVTIYCIFILLSFFLAEEMLCFVCSSTFDFSFPFWVLVLFYFLLL